MKKAWRVTAVILILWLAFGLRFHRLGAQSFWNDEGNSARLSERSPALIIEGTASDIHPPLYYLILRGWRELAGESEIGLRAFSAVAGVLTVAVVAALAKAVSRRLNELADGDGSLVLAAALLTAVNPALIYYSQETRMYALLALLAAASTWCLLNWRAAFLRAGRGVNGRALAWAGAYILLAGAGLYTHYFFPAVLAAQNLILLTWLLSILWRRAAVDGRAAMNFALYWLGMMGLMLLLYAPWLPVFGQQFGADDLSARGPFLPFLFTAVSWLAFGSTLALETVTWAVVLVGLLLVLGMWHGREAAFIFAICLIVPILFLYAAGTVQPAFLKFLLVAVPFFCLLLATVVARGKRGWRLAAALLLLVAVPLGTARSLQNMYANPAYARADYRGIAAKIVAEDYPRAAVILNAPNQWEVFTYYYPNETAVYPLPKGRSRPQPDAIAAALEEIAAAHDRIYVLFWGDGQRDPERLVERWLDEHAFKATESWVGDVRFVTYAVPDEAATTMETVTDYAVGPQMTLAGFTVQETQLRPGEILQVTLFWQTAVSQSQRYKVFLHLIGPDGELIAQRDSEPGGNLKPTTAWPPGETIIDNHGLLMPPDLPSGPYTLLVGLYDLADPDARLPITTPSGTVDALPLLSIDVRP